MFGNRKKNRTGEDADTLWVYAPADRVEHATLELALARDDLAVRITDTAPGESDVRGAFAVVALCPDIDMLSALMNAVITERQSRGDGTPVLVVGVTPDRLTEFGGWLADQAARGALDGLRLAVDNDPEVLARAAAERLEPVTGPSMVAMPSSTEIESADYKYFFCISPELRGLLSQLAELAENNIDRIYLLGGPGAGKTSLAYYYYLARQQGNFVTVNLTAESTDDKAAMKSLLCGHVAGAFPGAGSRTGAFAHAREGVCFLDESHGVSGSVMEVLMEALDSGQYLPYGASAKQPLRCAVVFASNRTWETLIGQINIDEHARLGAVILHLADLSVRREDLIAVLAATLAKMAGKSRTWTPPAGLSPEAWTAVRDCRWHGNTRALIRVVETAFVESAGAGGALIDAHQVRRAMDLWEPAEHASHALYTSASESGLGGTAG